MNLRISTMQIRIKETQAGDSGLVVKMGVTFFYFS